MSQGIIGNAMSIPVSLVLKDFTNLSGDKLVVGLVHLILPQTQKDRHLRQNAKVCDRLLHIIPILQLIHSYDSVIPMLHKCLLLILGRKCPFYTKDGLGILESPNFPGEYPAGAECHWRVRPGRNKRVLVIISNIELDENCGDVLTIRKTGMYVDRNGYIEK